MHTIKIIVGGFILLAVILLVGRWIGDGERTALVAAAKIFIPVWLVASLINMWIGVDRVGYTVADELLILLPVFGTPAAAAVFIVWHFSKP